jgi:hypothetical protein
VVTQYVQWGVGLEDFDNDSWPDLLYVTGHLYPEVERENADYPYRGPRVLFRNLGNGKFTHITSQCGPGLTTPHSSRGCAFGDFDNDGDVDVLVMNMNEPPSLLRSDVSSGYHWLKVKLIGVKSNRTAIGATVRVETDTRSQMKIVQSQSSYYSVNDLRLHFGIGRETQVRAIKIRWPNGDAEEIRNIAGDQLIHIREGEGIVKRERFPANRA